MKQKDRETKIINIKHLTLTTNLLLLSITNGNYDDTQTFGTKEIK